MTLLKPSFLDTWCEHPTTEIRWRVRRDNSGCWVRQCLTCGAQAGSQLSKTAPEVQNLPKTLFDPSIAERYDKARKIHWERKRQAEEQEKDRKQREWWQWYSRYLKSTEWKAKRAIVLKRSGGMCEGCRLRKATEVHHLTYAHAGNELLFELVAVCDSCHARLHPEKADQWQ